MKTGEARVSVGSNPTLSAKTSTLGRSTKGPQVPELQESGVARSEARRIGLPRWAVLPAAVVLVAVVALASRSAAVSGVTIAFDTGPLVNALQVAGYVAEFFGVAGLLAAVILYRAKTMRARTPEGSKRRPPPIRCLR